MGVYPILVRHFFARFLEGEELSPQAEGTANLGPLLGLLAAPGAFFGLLLQPLLIRQWNLVIFRYYYLAFSMITLAFLVVLKWDALFPDLRDYQVLTPLPLRPRTVFFSKIGAFALFLGLFLADVNVLGAVFWPGIDEGPNVLGLYGAHLAAIMAGGLFAALAAATVQGVLVTVLSGRAFRRVSTYLQAALLAVLTMLFFLTPLIARNIQGLVLARSPLLDWFPGFWFIGLYERLRPVTGNAVLADLGGTGLRALGWVTVAFLLTYLPGYRRHARNAIECTPANPAGPGRLRRAVEGALNRTILRRPTERAVFHFMSRTIARSMKHRIFLAVYGGVGAALGTLSLAGGETGLLRLPLTLSFILVSGLRAAFNFPAELRANWAFQLSESGSAGATIAAMRKWIALYAIVPLFVILAPMEFHFFAWPAALFHLVFGITLTVLLSEIMFFGFRKAAFACSYFPGRVNLVGLSVVYVLGFTAYSSTMAGVESWLAERPAAALSFLFCVAGRRGRWRGGAAAGWVRWKRRSTKIRATRRC